MLLYKPLYTQASIKIVRVCHGACVSLCIMYMYLVFTVVSIQIINENLVHTHLNSVK